jgi:phosphopantetheinyl transferase
MPIHFKKSLASGGEIGIWNITEDIDYFLSKLDLYPDEKVNLEKLHPIKKREWLSARHLLHLMSGRKVRTACVKDDFGKPFLVDSKMHISMSHSHDMSAVIASPSVCGIDIQLKVPKIERIAHKFLHTDEVNTIGHHHRLEKLHCYWGAKESIYKAFGRKSLDFKKHMRIEPFDFNFDGFSFSGTLKKEGFEEWRFKLYCSSFEDYILVYALEI